MAICVYRRVSLLNWLQSMIVVVVVPILADGFDHCIGGFWYSLIKDRAILQGVLILSRGWPCSAVVLGNAEAARVVPP